MSHWWGFDVDEDGKRRVAVNLRLVDPAPVADVPIRHFDALDTWMGWPMDGGASGTCGSEVPVGAFRPPGHAGALSVLRSHRPRSARRLRLGGGTDRANDVTPRPKPGPRLSLKSLRFRGHGSPAPTPPGLDDTHVRIG